MTASLASDTTDRALVVIAKAPRPGRVKTRLTPAFSPEEAAALSTALLTDTIALAATLPRVCVAVMCPIGEAPLVRALVHTDALVVEQRGSGLAAALGFTFERFLGAGYRKVVAFNSDSPHVACDALNHAFAALDRADLVVGPTEDGGYYLVGATAVHPGLFDPSPLGTSGALDALRRRAAELTLRVAEGTPAFDVDLPEDVTRLDRELQTAPERARATTALLADWRQARRLR